MLERGGVGQLHLNFNSRGVRSVFRAFLPRLPHLVGIFYMKSRCRI